MLSEKTFSSERGQSLVLVAAAMVILVLFVAITVDISNAYYHRRTAQNAADGAALAGVSRLATGINNRNKLDNQVQEDMNDFAERNGIEDTNDKLADATNNNVDGWYVDMEGNRLAGEPMVGNGSVPDGAYGIEAITYITAPAYFGGVAGVKGYSLQARAVSVLREACTADCVVPITTDYVTLEAAEAGQCFNIWMEKQRPNEEMTPGLLGWVNWTWQEAMCGVDRPCPEIDQGTNGCQVPVLGNNLNPLHCASGFVAKGDWMSGASGVMNASDVGCALDYYLGIPHDLSDCGVSSSVPVGFTIPVYDYTTADPEGGSGSSTPCLSMTDPLDPSTGGLHYHVVGFARMQLLGYQLSQSANPVPDLTIFDPSQCETLGIVPNDGFRITAQFVEWVDDATSTNACYDPTGTLLSAPRLSW